MIDLLIHLLTPFLVSLGVSEADANIYIRALSSYVYVIAGLLVLVIVIMAAAHFLIKKGNRHVVRWSAGLCWVLAVVVIVNMICYGPMYHNVSAFLNASRAEISDDVAGNSKAVIQEAGEEGMVLLKNEDLLPLSGVTNLNVFGWASTNPIYGGVGSGGGDRKDVIDILTSLENAGFATNEELSSLYTGYRSDRPTINMTEQDWTLPEPPMEYYTDSLMDQAKSFSDTAVVVVGRSGGENADLPTDMNAVIKGNWNVAATDAVLESVAHNYNYTNGVCRNNGSYADFDEGEHYLELSNTEEALMELVCENFENVIIVINANNAMELGWVEDYDSIGAVILAPGTGASGMAALGEILNGSINPSGRTADTYVYDLTDTPTWNNSGIFLYENVGDLVKQLGREDNTFNGVISFLNYSEGIYMGYKFYETAAEEGIITYEDKVQYPFGYGLSYTEFSQQIIDFKQDSKQVTVQVEVTNTGAAAGKDVVELYYTPPYYEGGIEKASVNLIDFAKTGLLEPGASETITLKVSLEDLASYDSSCVLTENGGYVLEHGEYTMSIRSDSHTVLDSRTFTLDADIDYSKDGRSSDSLTAVNQFDSMEGNTEYLSRADGFANFDVIKAGPKAEEYSLEAEALAEVKSQTIIGYKPEKLDNEEDVMPVTGADHGLKLADMTGKSYDDGDWDKLLEQMSKDEMTTLINTGGWQTAEVTSVGKMATAECDGPAGLNNIVTGATGTAFPTEVLMAQTWSKEIVAKIGAALGQEFANAENFGWYGPAMNLHRTAFSGRNFEYYSEDAVLSGIMASCEVNAAAEYGVYAYIKHFAGNDQEDNRTAVLLTYMTEQCFRENCLKPFEMVVKNFDYDNYVLGVMSSYNWIGTTPACGSYELLTTVLRDEWGFVGTVVSDYNGVYGYQMSELCIRAGGDLMLGYGMSEGNALSDSATTALAMRRACKNILYTVANSGYYYGEGGADTGGMSNMNKIFVTVDVIAVLLVLAVEALVLVRWMKKRRSEVKIKIQK